MSKETYRVLNLTVLKELKTEKAQKPLLLKIMLTLVLMFKAQEFTLMAEAAH